MICLSNDLLKIDMFADILEVGQNLAVFLLCNCFLARNYQSQREGVGISCSILAGEDAFPNPQGFEHLELLREEKSDPSKAIIEGIYLENVQSLPSLRLESLSNKDNTNSIVEMFLILS